jgi:hypothetical protein
MSERVCSESVVCWKTHCAATLEQVLCRFGCKSKVNIHSTSGFAAPALHLVLVRGIDSSVR